MKKDLGFVVVLLLVMSKLVYGVFKLYDLGHFEESYHRMAARNWLLRGMALEADFAPLYSLWILAWDTHATPYFAHYGNFILLTFFIGLTTYAIARRLTSANGALFAAAMVSLLQLNTATATKVSLFAAWIPLLFCALGFLFKKRSLALSVAITGVVVAVFIRVEMALSLALMLPLFFGVGYGEWRTQKTRALTLVAELMLPLASAISLLIYFGNPFIGNHWLVSLSQQFVRRWSSWFEPHYPWQLQFSVKWKTLFPFATTMTEAILQQPKLFARYFLSNLLDLPLEIYKAIFSLQFFSQAGLVGLTAVSHWLAAALLLSLIAGRKQIPEFIATLAKVPAWPLPLILVALLLPQIVSEILIFQEWNTLATTAIVFWIFSAAWLAYLLPQPHFAPMPSLPAWAAVVALILLTPFAWSPWSTEPLPDKPNLRMIHALNRLPLKKGTDDIIVADDFRGYSTYLDRRFVRLPPWRRETPLLTFLEKNNVGILVTIPTQPFLPEEQFEALQANAGSFGYKRFNIRHHSAIYVRQDLLTPSQKFTLRD